MHKLRNQAKHFYSSHTNRVNYDEFLNNHQELPSNVILRDLNETRIASRYYLLRSSLRLKQSLTMYFGLYQIPQKLDENEWEFAREVEAVLCISKEVIVLSQNEKLLNAAFGPVMKIKLHNSLNSKTMKMIDLNNWEKNARAPRIEVDIATWSPEGIECKNRALLECERRFFGNKSEEVFGNNRFIQLNKREQAVLVLEKRTCANKNVLSMQEWKVAIDALEGFYVGFYCTAMAYDRLKHRPHLTEELQPEPQQNENLGEDTSPVNHFDDILDLFEEAEMDVETEVLTEHDYIIRDQNQGTIEYQKVIKEWVKYRVPWRELYKEINIANDKTPDPFDDLMNLPSQPLLEHLQQNNKNLNNIFGFLPLMCKASPCQLGALNAQSFAERMISIGNLIITKKRTQLDDIVIKQLVVLQMNRKFMEFARENRKVLLSHVKGVSDIPQNIFSA